MTITEFASTRNVQMQTISVYIRRHKEKFKGHIKQNGKTRELDEVALKLLEEQYPLPKPVTIIEGVPREEYEKALKELANTQKKVIEMQEAYQEIMIASNTNNLLLESKTKELEQLKEELEKERSKSWIDKLFKR